MKEKQELISYVIIYGIMEKSPNIQSRLYANAVLKYNMMGKNLHDQLAYVIINLSSWKGEEARESKIKIKLWMKQNEVR